MAQPLPPPEDLTLPRPGSTTARGVLSRAIGRLLGDLREALRLGDPADVAALGAALAAVPQRQSVLMSLLRRPNVAALVRTARAPGADAAIVDELVATIAVELSVLSALSTPIVLRRPPRRVVSLAGRFVLELTGAGQLVIDPEGPRDVARGLFHPIRGDIVLALEDNNPLSMYEAHPRKSGNRIDLGGHSVDEWCESLGDALDRIERYLPDLRSEIDLFIQQFVPVGYDPEAHLSASYREAIGTIYLTLHPQPMTMTEAVIHEFSHNKLNALFEIDEVLHNAYAPLYKSPVRPDPRPLHGVLLAVHAFIPVARLYEAMLDAKDPLAEHPSFEGRFKQIVAGNHEGIEVLANAAPTDAGRAVLDELVAWDRRFAARGAA